MINTFLIKSKKENYYAFDFQNKELINISFFMYYYLSKYYNNVNEKTIIDEFTKKYKYEYLNDLIYIKYLLSNNYLLPKIPKIPVAFEKISKNSIQQHLNFPTQITFEVTDNCNLNCYYCSYGKLYGNYDDRKNKYLKSKKGIAFIDYIVTNIQNSNNKLKNQYIYISFYGGEPLLNFTFIKDIVNYCNNLSLSNIKFVFSMTTNALLLERYSSFLVENNFKLLISLDGDEFSNSYRELHNGENSYKTLLYNIEFIKNKEPIFFEKNINFNAVLHNKNNVSEIYEYFWKKFNKIPTIGELNSNGIKESKKEEFNNAYKNAYESFNTSKNKEYIENKVFIGLPHIQTLSLFLFKYTNFIGSNKSNILRILPTGTCVPFSKKIHITVNGKILPCEKIDHKYSLGNIDNNNDVNIDLTKIIDYYNYQYEVITEQCKSCYSVYSCNQCMYYMKDVNGRFSCPSHTNNNQFKHLLKDVIDYIEKHPENYNKIFSEIEIK